MKNEETGRISYYTSKKEVVYTSLMMCENALTLQPCAFQALIDWLDAPAMRGVNAISLSVTGQPSRPGWVTVNHLLLERDDEG